MADKVVATRGLLVAEAPESDPKIRQLAESSMPHPPKSDPEKTAPEGPAIALWIPWSASERPGTASAGIDDVATDGPEGLLSDADLTWAGRNRIPVLRTPSPPPECGVVYRARTPSSPWMLWHPQLHSMRSPQAGGGFCVDFVQGPSATRLRSMTKSDALPRAVGANRRTPTVVDATAGLGADAAALAALGLRVIAWEANPVVHRLLEDGLRRGESAGLPWVQHLKLQPPGDACDALAAKATTADVVLLDPMYPDAPRERRKSRLPAQLLQLLVGMPGTQANHQLFQAARNAAKERVVVKRQGSSAPLVDDPQPSHTVRSKSVRFDVYLQPGKPDSNP